MDKPMMQFKLSIPDSDALRAMIQRDYKATLADAKNIEVAGASTVDPTGALMHDAQKRMHQGERLAEIFSVNLDKR